MMRFYFVFLLFLLFFGCTLEEKTPLHAESMRLLQNDDQVILTVIFSGNVAPEQASGKLLLLTNSGKTLYDREFSVKKGDFKKLDQFILERYIKLNTNEKFDYAELYLYLPNQTFHAEQGSRPDVLEINGEVLAHEKQYAVRINFIELGKNIKTSGTVELRILDFDGTIYKEILDINEGDFKEGYLTIFLSYEKIPKSFYKNGNLLIKFEDKEKRLEIPLREYSEKEKSQIEDMEFSSNAKPLVNKTDYVGFEFNIMQTGYYIAHSPEKTKAVRFDARIKNTLNRPQYLMRDDFYIKDSDKNFYPVYGKLSTAFTPILKPNEEINASFYFNIIAEKDGYSLYYGDKKLAEFSN